MTNELAYEQTYRRIFQVLSPSSVTQGERDADVLTPGRGFMQDFD